MPRTVYSRQLFFGYCGIGFFSLTVVPDGELWIVKNVLAQFQAEGGHLDLAVFDGDNWGSIQYTDQSGTDNLDYNQSDLFVVMEEGQSLVSITTTADVALLVSGYKLTLP